MKIWTPTCPTHGEWNASRESACPSCMVDARKRIAELERELAEVRADYARDRAWYAEDHKLLDDTLRINQQYFDDAAAHGKRADKAEEYAKRMSALVDAAVAVLQRHIEPGGPSDKDTISALWSIFDGPEYQEAMAKNPVGENDVDGVKLIPRGPCGAVVPNLRGDPATVVTAGETATHSTAALTARAFYNNLTGPVDSALTGHDPRDTLRLRWLAETTQLSQDDFSACNWNETLLGMVMERFKLWRRLPPNDALDAIRKAIDTQVVHEGADAPRTGHLHEFRTDLDGRSTCRCGAEAPC